MDLQDRYNCLEFLVKELIQAKQDGAYIAQSQSSHRSRPRKQSREARQKSPLNNTGKVGKHITVGESSKMMESYSIDDEIITDRQPVSIDESKLHVSNTASKVSKSSKRKPKVQGQS